MHGTRHIHNEDVFSRGNLIWGKPFGRLHHEQEEVLLRSFIEQQAGFDGFSRKPVVENKIAVATGLFAACEPYTGPGRVFVAHVHLVRSAGQLLNGQPRGKMGDEIKGISRFPALVEIGVGNPLFGCRRGGGLIGIAWSNHGRINKLVGPCRRGEQFRVAKLGFDLITGQDVGHIHLEHIGTLLLQKRRTLPLLPGLLISPACFLALLNLSRDGAFPNGHFHSVNRGFGRSRENVDRFERLSPFIPVNLGHGHVRNNTGDIHHGSSGFERELVDTGVVTLDQEIRGKGLVLKFGFSSGPGLSHGKYIQPRRHGASHPVRRLLYTAWWDLRCINGDQNPK